MELEIHTGFGLQGWDTVWTAFGRSSMPHNLNAEY
jgi:hypothetical protein